MAPEGPVAGRAVAPLPGTAAGGRLGLVLVLVAEGEVDAHQRLLLLLGQVVVGEDVAGQVGVAVRRLEDPGLHVEGLRRDPEGLGDLLEDLRRRSPQPPFDLAQVGVGDPGQLRQSAEGQPGAGPLLADERAELVEALGDLLDELGALGERVRRRSREETVDRGPPVL